MRSPFTYGSAWTSEKTRKSTFKPLAHSSASSRVARIGKEVRKWFRIKKNWHFVADKCSVLSLLEPSNPAKSDDLAVNDASSVSSGRACVQYAVFTRPSVQELIMTNFPSLGTFLTSDDYGVSLPLSSRFNCKRLCSNFKQPIVIIKVSSRK